MRQEPLSSICAVLAAVAIALSVTARGAEPDKLHAWEGATDTAALEAWVDGHLRQSRALIDELASVSGARTLRNTLRPYDSAAAEIGLVRRQARLLQRVHPDKRIRDDAQALAQRADTAAFELSLNPAVYRALAALDLSRVDPGTRHYVERTLLEYRLAGVDKDDATRARLQQLRDRSTQLGLSFARNISESVNKVVVRDVRELDGLPADYIARHAPAQDGGITLTTDFPDYAPLMKFSTNAALRRQMYLAYNTRAYPANRQVLLDLLRVRQEIAETLGYKTWADLATADLMMQSGANMKAFLQRVETVSRSAAERESALVVAFAKTRDPALTSIDASSASFWDEQYRRSSFDFDSQSVRPYFPFARVQQGILDVAAKFFHVRFEPARGAIAWDPSVAAWDVFDADRGAGSKGRQIGRFYLDMHPREGKDKWFSATSLVQGIRGVRYPEAALICNFTGGTADDPGLMEYQDVVVFFHEFGHLMHAILGGDQPWAGISGITTEGDFVEAPSQMLEEFFRNPALLRSFARHYKTGEPIPEEVVARMNRASAFGRGSWVRAQLSYSQLSLDLHDRDVNSIDPDAILHDDFVRYRTETWVEGSRMYASFGHLQNYTSNYYTYLFDKVIALDFFNQFKSRDPLSDPAAMRYRRSVLEPGGSMPGNDLVRRFLGRTQGFEAFERWLKEEFASPSR